MKNKHPDHFSFFKRAILLKIVFTIVLSIFLSIENLSARRLYYLEEFYRIYYHPHRAENEDYLRNIHWLRVAMARPFAPPIHALKPPDNKPQYTRYQKLMRMHLRYLLVKNTVYLAARFDKHRPVFYNLPYKESILESLGIAEYLYTEALKDWAIVLSQFDKFNNNPEIKRERVKLEFLEKMIYRMTVGELDYNRVIDRRLEKVRENKIYFSSETEEN